eukprot:gene7518-8351_t
MQFQRKNNPKRKGPRGPRPKVLAIKMYHLPEASQIPSLGVTTRGLVKQHMDEGYGFPKECFNSTTNKSKQTSFSIHLSEVQVSAKIREILPKLGQQDFDLFKMDKRRKLELVPVGSRDAQSLWELHYQGVYIVKAAAQNAYVPVMQHTPADNVLTGVNVNSLAEQDTLQQSQDVGTISVPTTSNNTTAIDIQSNLPSQMILPPLPFQQQILPTQLIELTIVGGNRVERLSFGGTCRPQDVYSSVQEKFGVADFLLLKDENRNYILPKLSNLSMIQWGIQSGEKYVIEEDIDQYFGLPQLPSGDDSDSEDPEISIRQVMNRQELQLRRIQAYTAISATQQLLVRRDQLVNDALQQYQDTSIVHHKLFVKFDGERGEDLEGLTREFFSQFWQNWAQKLVGHNKKFINLVPNSLIGAEELGAIGRILVHGYILCGYLPYFVNSSVLYWLLVGREPSLDLIFNEFFLSLDEGDQHLVTAALDSAEISEEMKIQLGAFLATYDFGMIPNKDTLMGTLKTLSRYVTIIKPYYYLQAIRIPIEKIASKLFGEPTEEEFTTMLNSLVPAGVEVVSKLKFKYSDNDTQYALEERVAGFLQTFLVSLGRNDIMSFVRFVSGCEILPASIQVEFNGESNEEMMIPSAHTCSISLHISRYFLTYQSLQSVFKNLLVNKRLWSSFDVV